MTKPNTYTPLPGYPIADKFSSREAVENYLSDDRITCLMCGRSYKALGGHLMAAHGMTGDEYKDQFNIPYNYGLARETTRRKFSEQTKRRIAENPEFAAKLTENRAKLDAARERGEIKNRPRRDFVTREHTERILRNAGQTQPFGDVEKRKFLDGLANGETQMQALKATGFEKSALHSAKRRDPAFKEMVARAIEAQPFHVQAKQQTLGKRFKEECIRLMRQGMSDHAIADKLGVTAMSVNRRTKPARKEL